MKIITMFLLFLGAISFAQTNLVLDDMEWTNPCPNHWDLFLDCPTTTILQSHTGQKSGFMPNDLSTHYFLSFGSRIFGSWFTEFWMYVPADKEAFIGIKDSEPICCPLVIPREFINVNFNQNLLSPGVGLVSGSILGDVFFDFPHEEWFKIRMEFDISIGISMATWSLAIDNIETIPAGTQFIDDSGTGTISLGGLYFLSESTNTEFYFDDFGWISSSIEEFNQSFSLTPNPAHNNLFLVSNSIDYFEVTVYNLMGSKVYGSNMKNSPFSIDISTLQNGIYIIVLATDKTKEIHRFIKK